jgi:TetR/AcrR family transcriptional regulator, transcriptional repressor for nem operon
LPALTPELARADKTMKPRIFEDLKKYKSRMLPFMPGQRTADKDRVFFSIFSTIVRMLPEHAMREKVLGTAREFLLRGF